MEGKPGASSPTEEAAPPSVAKLAGLFGDKVNSPRKEAPPHKPTRKKPPCSLPLPKPEATNNGDEKVSPPHTQMPKIKVKSSPLIEKLQANLAFAPASFLPGPSPKSPGLKVMASPFTSPPSTPSSPGFQSRASESSEVSPVSFEQPPEGAALPSYTKVRTRGSLKRRPPSRRFRKSQTDMDFDIDAMSSTPKENGDKEEEKGTGSAKGDTQEAPTEPSVCQTDAESPDPAAKSTESPLEEPAKAENEEGLPGTEQEEKPGKDEAALDADTVTDSPIAKEETEKAEGGDGARQEKDENDEPSKSDGDDKPEK